jgi:cytochrome c oxidase subunit II
MKKFKSLGVVAVFAALALGGSAIAQAPAPAPTTASPTATATAPGSGQAPAIAPAAASSAAPAAAPATAAQATPAPAASKIPEFNQPTPGIGQPTDHISLQPQVTDLGQFAQHFDTALIWVISFISLFVLLLLVIVAVRFNRRANPTPSRTSHNTTIEIVWTVAPVLILLCIAVPSIKLLARQYSTPKPDLTVKVIGHQWYWSYQYPDNGDFEVVSNILTDAQDKAKGEPRQLGVDARMVVPVDSVIKIITTSDDVIHSFAVPAFWTKMDAVPGRLNETWFKVKRTGLYYGQCSELCGARHGYMPIAVDVVTKAQFAQWVAANGGTMPGSGPGAKKPASSDATANSPVSNPPATTANPEPGAGAPTTATENSTATATPASQAATTN